MTLFSLLLDLRRYGRVDLLLSMLQLIIADDLRLGSLQWTSSALFGAT